MPLEFFIIALRAHARGLSKASFNFMLIFFWKSCSEQVIQVFVDAMSANDKARAAHGTKRQDKALRGVKDEDGVGICFFNEAADRE